VHEPFGEAAFICPSVVKLTLPWRSLKYECVYLNAFDNGTQARNQIGAWLRHDYQTRPHSTFDGPTPDEVYHLSHLQGSATEDKKHAA